MNPIQQRLAKSWIMAITHYIRVYAAIACFGAAAALFIEMPDEKTGFWLTVAAITIGLAIGLVIVAALTVLNDIHRCNPELCRWCRRLRTRITRPERTARFAINCYHSVLIGILALTAVAFIITGIFTDGVWPIIVMNICTGFMFTVSALHSRYRHVCERCQSVTT